MRILLACEFYFPSTGGVQEVVRQVAERLVERGHRVSVATSDLPGRKAMEMNGVSIVPFKASGNLVRGMSGDVEDYRRFVLQADYDVFMVKAAQQWTFDALLPVLERMHKPKVFIPCGFAGLFEPAYADYYRAMPAALRRFDHLIFYASHYRDIDLARKAGLTNFSFVPNGASEREFGVARDPAFRRRHGIGEQAFVVLTVGTLTGGQKGHRELAEAFALASLGGAPAVLLLNGNEVPRAATPRSPAQWLAAMTYLVRDGSAFKRMLMAVGRRLGIGGEESLDTLVARINLAVPDKRAMILDLPRAELVQAYLNSDLFVFASRIEYSPLVLYEAAAAGLPFLSVPVGNADEIAQWTGGGTICPAPQDARGYTRVDPGVLAEHIDMLAADRTKLAILGQTGHRNWAEKFTWEKITERYEALFTGLAGQGNR